MWALLGLCLLLYQYAGLGVVHGCTVTSPAAEGPYYKPDAPIRTNGTICKWEEYENGTQLLVRGRVYDSDCKTPLKAALDLWTANPYGEYSPQQGPDYTCRGRINTDADGFYEYLTIVPGRYLSEGSLRPAHIHYKVNRVNDAKTLTTQLYFVGDPYVKIDPCDYEYCRAGDPTLTEPLLPALDASARSFTVRFDIVL